MFGEALARSRSQIPAQLRQHSLVEGLRILGGHPSGKEARELVELYRELVSEVELVLTLDRYIVIAMVGRIDRSADRRSQHLRRA